MTVAETLEKELATLPDNAQIELLHFIRYLQYKYTNEKKIVALKGLWENVPLDIEQDDIRNLRQQLSQQVLDKYPSS